MNGFSQRWAWFAIAAVCFLGSPEIGYAQNGACCSEELGCFEDTELDCNNFGGTWAGPNTSCENDDCAFGACCLEEGCENLLRGVCTNSGGNFFAFTFCSQDPCGGGDPVGACCASLTPGAGCQDDVTQSACEEDGRIFIGAGISCTPNPCGGTDPVRACCHGEGCSELSQEDCDSIEGIWAPTVATCSAFTCFQSACCIEGGCEELIETECNAAGGVWLIFQTCVDDPCGGGDPIGACCSSLTPGAGCLDGITQSACEGDGRIFMGEGTSCTPNPCGGEDPIRACCHGEGCSEIDEEFCNTIAGTWLPTVMTCGESTCAQGACCTEGSCEEMLEAECDTAGGTWLIFQSCGEDPCGAGTGACCENQTPGSFCFQDSQANCEANGRIFIGIGIPCEPLPCAGCATCDGDSNGDAALDGRDVQAFVGCLIEAGGGPVPEGCECSDMNHDGNLTTGEIPDWVTNLLNNTGLCSG